MKESNISEAVGDLILDLSGHRIIETQWSLITRKLRQFSFTMQPGLSMKEILEFEHRIKKKLPWDMRVSLMMCSFIEIPPIFGDSSDFELMSNPLDGDFIRRDDYAREIYQDNCDDDDELEIAQEWFNDENYVDVMRITTIDIDNELQGEDLTDIYWNADNHEILFANSSSDKCGNDSCYVRKYDSWLHFLRASTEKYLEKQEMIGPFYNRDGLDFWFLREISEAQKTDFDKMDDYLEDFTGRWYGKDRQTVQLVLDMFQDAKVMDSNKKKRKLDENDDLRPPQKKLK